MFRIISKLVWRKNIALHYNNNLLITRRYGPLHWPSSSSCKVLWTRPLFDLQECSQAKHPEGIWDVCRSTTDSLFPECSLFSFLRLPHCQSPECSQDAFLHVLDSLLSKVQRAAMILVLLAQMSFFQKSGLSSWLRLPYFYITDCNQDACPPNSDSLLSRVQITARMLVLLSQIPFFPESKLQPGCLSSWLCCSPLFWRLQPPQRIISWR